MHKPLATYPAILILAKVVRAGLEPAPTQAI